MQRTIFRFRIQDSEILTFTDESEEHARELFRMLEERRITAIAFFVNGRIAGVSVRTARSREEILDLITLHELG